MELFRQKEIISETTHYIIMDNSGNRISYVVIKFVDGLVLNVVRTLLRVN
jgi:hypothetical protein